MSRYFDGYNEARERIKSQSLEDDLRLINDLYGTENLKYSATPEEVKQEALRQLERDWRNPDYNNPYINKAG